MRTEGFRGALLPILMVAALIVPAISLLSGEASAQLTSGLVGYWKFDEGSDNLANDNSGMGNHGTIYGASWTEGMVKKALSFDGVDDYVHVPHSSSLNDYSQGLTLMAWIKTDTTSKFKQMILAKGDGTGYYGTDYTLELHEDNLFFGVGAAEEWVVLGALPYALKPNEWYHVAGTWDGTSWTIYVNGELKASGENYLGSSLNFTTNPLYIGQVGNWSWTFFNGVIDEPRIYNRGLSADEIKKCLTAGLGTAVFSLVDLYTVNVEKILDLNQGSKLVVKFYTYVDAYENENVIENFSPPWSVEENESARHPEGVGVKKARLDLTTDNTEDVLATIASFVVLRVTLEIRFTEIPLEWALASPEEKVALEIEFSEIPFYWALAPS